MKERADYIRYFRSLDKALNEHEQKGTRRGDKVFDILHDQLAEDLAEYGFGKDELRDVAERCAQLTTYERLSQLRPKQHSPEAREAIGLFRRQIDRVNTIGDGFQPVFAQWFTTTTNLFERFLGPKNHSTLMFKNVNFFPPTESLTRKYGEGRTTDHSWPEYRVVYSKGRATAIGLIDAAIEHIETFGLARLPQHDINRSLTSGSAEKNAGVIQNFYGNVDIKNQAIATDSAIQHVKQVTGSDLEAIASVLKESDDLSRRDLHESLHAIEVLATETGKEESKRDWKAVLDSTEKITSISQKATDVTLKIAPHLPWIFGVAEHARKMFGG